MNAPSSPLPIVRAALPSSGNREGAVCLRVDRRTLSKYRWRGVAEDGAEVGFDLTEPLRNGDLVGTPGGAVYVLQQAPEALLEIALRPDASASARLGWLLGNLHQQIELRAGAVRLPDDPAVRALLLQEQLPVVTVVDVFQPLRGGHHH